MEDKVFVRLRNYFSAFANLYGIIPLSKAYEIIMNQNEGMVTKEEFLKFIDIARHECENYWVLGEDELFFHREPKDPLNRMVIDAVLLRASDAYARMNAAHEGKSWYIPKKTKLLRYAYWDYMEESPETEALKTFMREEMKLGATKTSYIFGLVAKFCRQGGYRMQELVDMLEENGIKWQSDEQFFQFMQLVINMHNQARMQSNRGHTPEEIRMAEFPEEKVSEGISFVPGLKSNIQRDSVWAEKVLQAFQKMAEKAGVSPAMLQAGVKARGNGTVSVGRKIGRNELCPCGNGKKYKKCCGR